MSNPDRRTQELLDRWERGELSTNDLSRMSPDAAALAELYSRLNTLSTEDHIPDVDAEWARLEPRLPERARTKSATRWLTRPLLVAAIVVGMTGAVAFADPQIGHQLGGVWSAIQGLTGHPKVSIVGEHPSTSPVHNGSPSAENEKDHARAGHPTPSGATSSGSGRDK